VLFSSQTLPEKVFYKSIGAGLMALVDMERSFAAFQHKTLLLSLIEEQPSYRTQTQSYTCLLPPICTLILG